MICNVRALIKKCIQYQYRGKIKRSDKLTSKHLSVNSTFFFSVMNRAKYIKISNLELDLLGTIQSLAPLFGKQILTVLGIFFFKKEHLCQT